LYNCCFYDIISIKTKYDGQMYNYSTAIGLPSNGSISNFLIYYIEYYNR